jgi:AcrR family transcriptional regulator
MPPPDPKLDTKQRILDAAEVLFFAKGVAGSSLRAVTAEAGVNVAAVHYHFGSKPELLRAGLERRIGPSNQERFERLEAARAGGRTPSVEEVLEAFLAPMIVGVEVQKMAETSALLHREPRESLEPLLRQLFGEVGRVFVSSLGELLPQLGPHEVTERFQLVVGVMVHVISGHLSIEFEGVPYLHREPELLLGVRVQFLAAGLRAPAYSAPPNLERGSAS